jgi:putative two-component system response regulator
MIQGKKSKVLVVDDNLWNRELLEVYLSGAGYKVVTAGDGREALKRVKKGDIDLILLDVMMPELNGYEVCEKIKENEKTRFIPIIMITALKKIEDKIKGIEAGADDFLNKPVNKHELFARTKSLIRLKHLNNHLENTENVLFALSQTVEAKDPCTEGHLERIANYSSVLGKLINLPYEIKIVLKRAGILHDIGKIGISENILCKPGPLTKEEFEKMKEHTIIGEKIIKPLRFSEFIAPIVRGHHERWDGKGYPDGLAGEKIPIGARIISIVDAYDAMTTDRPYRRRMPKKKAIDILREGKRTQWDAELVDVFVNLLMRKEA